MRNSRIKSSVFFFAAILAQGTAAPLSAEVTIKDIGWQLALQVKDKKTVYHDIKRWLFPPSPTMKLRPRAVVTLSNRGDRPESAILLRYAFTARLRKIGKEGEGTWTVPFLVEEKRIMHIAAQSTKEVYLPLNRMSLRTYLARMYGSGYWPDAFNIRVIVEPRPGETFKERIGEKELPTVWNAASMKEGTE